MLPLRSIGRSNFVMVCINKNLTTLIKKKRHILMRTAIYIYIYIYIYEVYSQILKDHAFGKKIGNSAVVDIVKDVESFLSYPL